MSITIVGLGPAGLEHLTQRQFDILLDPRVTVIVRTLRHPAATEIAAQRTVESCDDLYDSLDSFDDVYHAIVDRVLKAAQREAVVFAVPGSAAVGERSARAIRDRADAEGLTCEVLPGLSFLDLVYAAVDVDPITDGVQVLDAHELPDPLPLHVPTVITQVDTPYRAADVSVALGTILPNEFETIVLDRLGEPDQVIEPITVADVARYAASERTTLFVPAVAVGLLGLVTVNRILRRECPWDRKQTHHSLLTHLIEEAYETADAIGALSSTAPDEDPDFGAYAEVEEELGDLLLQVVFHATLASETGAFDIDEVAEGIRRKLVARHPHVFADVEVDGADEVLANWEQIKQAEKGRDSLMDDIPSAMPSMAKAIKVQKRAASVGFDWDDRDAVVSVLRSEIEELTSAATDGEILHEVGDVLFSAINVSRHLGVDPELALRGGVDRFTTRFRSVETSLAADGTSVSEASAEQLAAAWQMAKK